MYESSPLLKRVAYLPIYGAKAKLAQTYGAWKIAEIDIPESAPGPKGHPQHFGRERGEGNSPAGAGSSSSGAKKIICSARSAFAKLKQQIRGAGTLLFLSMQQSLERTYAKVAF